MKNKISYFVLLLTICTRQVCGMESNVFREKKLRVFFVENKYNFLCYDVSAYDKNGINLTDHFKSDKPKRYLESFLRPHETTQLIILDSVDERVPIKFPLTIKATSIGPRYPSQVFEVTENDHGRTFVIEPIDFSKEIKKTMARLDCWFSENIETEADCNIQ